MLTTDHLMPFGKYKGRLVREILRDEPGYLAWLRHQKMVDVGEVGAGKEFSNEIHAALNELIDSTAKLRRNGYKKLYNGNDAGPVAELDKTFKVTMSEVDTDTLKAALGVKPPVREYQDWGAW